MVHIILDTNIFLHYEDFESIDWERLVSDKYSFCIVITVVKELDKHKRNNNKKLASRAKKVLKSLHSYQKSGDNKTSKEQNISFNLDSPSLNTFKLNSLDKAESDDYLLASILELSKGSKDKYVLFSGDIGILMKAISIGISGKEMPEKYLLKNDQDSIELENKKLRRDIQRLNTAIPKLEVTFKNGKTNIEYQLNGMDLTEDEFIKKGMIEVKETVHKLDYMKYYNQYIKPKESRFIKPYFIGGHTPNDYILYNEQIPSYYIEYKEYLAKVYAHKSSKAYSFNIELNLKNIGKALADNIDVTFYFPDGFILYHKEDFPKFPEAPKLPVKEWERRLLPFPIPNPMRNLGIDSVIESITFGSPTIEKTNSYAVTYDINSLKHNLVYEFQPLVGELTNLSLTGFKIEYEIYTANLPEITKGVLNVKLKY